MITVLVVSFAVSLAVSFALAPSSESVAPAGIDDIKMPTAETGRQIPVLFGTREIAGANCLWYGDLSSSPIRQGGK